jgi:alpha-galactosidase
LRGSHGQQLLWLPENKRRRAFALQPPRRRRRCVSSCRRVRSAKGMRARRAPPARPSPLSLLLLLAAAAAAPRAARAANDGLARTPPRGWRSWDADYGAVTQDYVLAQCALLVDRSRGDPLTGAPTSLAELGYSDCGLDDAWQECGSGAPGWSFHNASGDPQVDAATFPSLGDMVRRIHALNLSAGFYLNNCICSDRCNASLCFEGDVRLLRAAGFDGVKLDGCGAELDPQRWYSLLAASPVVIENAHNGATAATQVPWGSSYADAAGCPFHLYRSSSDLYGGFGKVVYNLQTVFPFAAKNLSGPGCWAYPDMLNFLPGGERPGPPVYLSDAELRSHFGAWAVVSSPLVLSLDLRNASLVDRLWPFVANREALAINAAWAGAPGAAFAEAGGDRVHVPGCPGCDPFMAAAWQQIAKPLAGGAAAVLVLNYAANATRSGDIAVNLSAVPGLAQSTAGWSVRDVWARRDAGGVAAASPAWPVPALQPHDSAFVVFTPLG